MAYTQKIEKHHVEIQVRRPGGQIETITKSDMTQPLFERMAKATRDAGKGELLSWAWVSGEIEISDADEAAELDEKAYNAGTSAIYRAMDAKQDSESTDSTPAHKSDM